MRNPAKLCERFHLEPIILVGDRGMLTENVLKRISGRTKGWNPIHWVKLPKKWEVFERRMHSPEQKAQMLGLLEERTS